jgi:hypothetical protein
VLDIIESDVSTLRNRRTARNSKSDVLQILESRRKFGEDQVSIESVVRDVGESRNGQLLVVDSVRHNTEHAGLGKTSGSAGVGSKAEPEAFEVERLDAASVRRAGGGREGRLLLRAEAWSAGPRLRDLRSGAVVTISKGTSP